MACSKHYLPGVQSSRNSTSALKISEEVHSVKEATVVGPS